MVLGLRDLAAFAVPAADPDAGARGIRSLAGGLREMAQLGQQRELEQQRLTQQAELQKQRIAAEQAQARATQQAAIETENRKRAESRRVGAQKVYGEVYQMLSQPGGAAMVERKLPELQAHGVSWQALPGGGYGFVYESEAGAEQWGKLDLGKMSAEDKARTEALLGAAQRAQTGRTPTEVAAAGAETVSADPSLAGKNALAAFGSATNQRQGDLAAMDRARVAASAARAAAADRKLGGDDGSAGLDPMNVKRAGDRQMAIVMRFMQQGSTKALHQRIAETKASIAQMGDTANPLSQNSAFFKRLTSMQKGALSDRDIRFQLSEAGKWNLLDRAIKQWTDTGRFPDEYRAYFEDAAELLLRKDSEQLSQVARAAGDVVRMDPTIPLYVRGNQAFHDYLVGQAEETILGGNAGVDSQPPAPDGYDADAEADRLLGEP